ncbi:Werner Syndrome-like exonuclease [Quillaja saponaria]|uniref:3'-5' exonuclease n=1 Tax=Quillaja saponaria TaxID=32244 RepID=A0AAD7PIW2_QUISA|nr:Werner Syndrome-like exonuclease [Quillaja saponaria]
MSQNHSLQDKDSSSELATSISYWDEEEPFTEEQLQAIEAIEAAFQSSASSFTKKCPLSPTKDDIATADAFHSESGRRLPKSLIALQHPNAFSLSRCQANSRMRLPRLRFGGQIMYSRTATDIETAARELLGNLEAMKREMAQTVIGFDIEWKPTFRRGETPRKVAVMQICGCSSHCYVLHIIHSGIPRSLQLLLEDPAVLKVGVGIANDSVKVFKDYNISIKGVEDLSFHANQKLDGDPRNWGLASLTETLLSKQLLKPKKIRLGNWEADVLSKEQLHYAATDAFASWYLYEVIKGLPDSPKVAAEKRRKELEGVSQS